VAISARSQYYLRGEVRDEKNKPLPYARIFLHSARMIYTSGAGSGSFGINTKVLYDSLTVTLDGFETAVLKVKSDQWQTIILKAVADASSKNQNKLISSTQDYNRSDGSRWFSHDETYFQLVENAMVETEKFPKTGYSLNVNKASYSNVRRFINMGSKAPPDAVRTEELVNYFNLGYHAPDSNQHFHVASHFTSCPWDKEKKLLAINASAKKLDLEKIPAGNFVFLIDVSGSMDMPNRLPLLKSAFRMFVKNLRPVDTISIVTYGGYVQIWLKPTSGADQETILKSIDQLVAEGDTPGESAIKLAYQVASRTYIKGGTNRVILATDGDFNVGETSEKALDELISKKRQSGVYLTCLGVGMGNFKDSKLQTLAKKGNGNYAYLDDIREAERVLVLELTQTIYAVADDACINVKFNPEAVKSYRLIGFDNKKEALKDTSSNLEGGEIGSGANVMALFEIVTAEGVVSAADIGSIELKYTQHQDSIVGNSSYLIANQFLIIENTPSSIRFASAIAMFGMKLRESSYCKECGWADIQKLAKGAADKNNYTQEEFLSLLEKASKTYGNKKRKRKVAD
jgi:Ca-activated chloride channel family protein